MAASRGRRRSGGLLGKLSERFSDPKRAGGSIDKSAGLVDPKRAVLLQEVAVAEVGMERADKGEGVFAIELTGVINTVGEPANILVLASPDSAALLLAQITAVARGGRIGPEFDHCLVGRMEEAIGG
jgi:hypothetical protein